MLLVRLGRIIAWALIIFGGVRVAMGLYVAQNFAEPAAYAAATARYLGSATSGETIDRGLMWIAAGVAFGLLARAASRHRDASTQD